MDKIKMGIFLQTLRKDRGLTQEDEAEIFAITPQAISKWESGQSIPDVDTLEKLSRFYGVSINEIIAGEEISPAPKQKATGAQGSEAEKSASGPSSRVLPFIVSCVFMALTLLFYFIPCFGGYITGTAIHVTATMYSILGGGISQPINICVWLAFLSTLTLFGLGFGYFFDGKRVLGYRLAQIILGWSIFALYALALLIAGTTQVGVLPGYLLIVVVTIAYIVLFYVLPQNRKQRLKESLKQ
ncbi:MAG: helix-turn-helix transcriptional regulator [Bacilli bacterium]|nr:helix-turn-helix transcriptional regulator [Bacilli bacterium]